MRPGNNQLKDDLKFCSNCSHSWDVHANFRCWGNHDLCTCPNARGAELDNIAPEVVETNKPIGWFIEDGLVKQVMNIFPREVRAVGRLTTPGNNQPCDRIYEDGAYTVKFINGVACCPSCGLPVKEHTHG